MDLENGEGLGRVQEGTLALPTYLHSGQISQQLQYFHHCLPRLLYEPNEQVE